MLAEDKIKFIELSDDKCMAVVIAGEARGEGDDLKIPYDEARDLVGSIVLNRADYGQIHHGWGKIYGDSIKSVIDAKNQFSCLNSNDVNYPLLAELINDFDASLVKYPWLPKIYADAKGLLDGSIPRMCKGIYYETTVSAASPYSLFAQYKAKGIALEVEVKIGRHQVYTLESSTKI
jgi:hypothetical protein